jgi:hypothetical protein
MEKKMAKKLKDPENTNSENMEAPAEAPTEAPTKPRRKYKKKPMTPTYKKINDTSYIGVSAGPRGNVSHSLFFKASSAPENPEFLFIVQMPDGEGEFDMMASEMGLTQAQAVFDSHTKKVAKSDMPPECPLVVE